MDISLVLSTIGVDGIPSEVLFILGVSPAKRGLKVGQQFIARAFQLAAKDGLGCAELIAVEGRQNIGVSSALPKGPHQANFWKSLRPMEFLRAG